MKKELDKSVGLQDYRTTGLQKLGVNSFSIEIKNVKVQSLYLLYLYNKIIPLNSIYIITLLTTTFYCLTYYSEYMRPKERICKNQNF